MFAQEGPPWRSAVVLLEVAFLISACNQPRPGLSATESDGAAPASDVTPDGPAADRPRDATTPDELAPDARALDAAMCRPSSEDCFNGLDDDCDGRLDCLDDECGPNAAVCVASQGFSTGVTIESNSSCPVSFTAHTDLLHENLIAGNECSGCSCTPGVTECENAKIHFFATEASCLVTGGQVIDEKILSTKNQCVRLRDSHGGGYRFAGLDMRLGCNTSGQGRLPAPTWARSQRFCKTERVGAGCGAGQVCAPVAGNGVCLFVAGDAPCPGGLTKRPVFTSFTDSRTCTCACTGVDGDCEEMVLDVGDDSDRNCNGGGAYYGAGGCGGVRTGAFYARLSGTPRNPTTCTTSSSVVGSITENGRFTLCCR